MTHTHKQYTFTQRIERGSVLAITLMLLVILALLGTFAIRNSTKSERVMNGIRTSNVSEHAAETALRFCEQLVLNEKVTVENKSTGVGAAKNTEYKLTAFVYKAIKRVDQEDAAWLKKENWKITNDKLLQVPTEHHKSTHAPQCIIEKLKVKDAAGEIKVDGYVITARGFGDDAVFKRAEKDGEGDEVISGAETWLQSTLTKKNS